MFLAELRATYPEFFYREVHPYIGPSLGYLRQTEVGKRWIANLFHHVHSKHLEDEVSGGPERALPTDAGTIAHISVPAS